MSALGFGAGLIDSSRLDERSARVLLETAIQLGVTFVDTARGLASPSAPESAPGG